MRSRHALVSATATAGLVASLGACFSNSSGNPSGASFDAAANDSAFGTETGDDAAIPPDGTAPLDTGTAPGADGSAPVDAAAHDASVGDAVSPADSAPTDAAPMDAAAADAAPADAAAEATVPSEAGLAGPIAAGSSLTWPEGLVVLGTTLYWLDSGDPHATNAGTMQSCDLSAGTCNPQPVTGMTSLQYNHQLASDGTSFFLPFGPPAHAFDVLEQCSVASCKASLTTVNNVGFWDDITGVAVDATSVYYAAGAIGGPYSLWSVTKGGAATPVQITSGLQATANIAVDASNLYVGLVGGGIYTCPLGGDAGPSPCASPTLLQSTTATSGLAVDATHLYWGDPTAGAVYRCPLAGCGASSPTAIVTAQGHVNSLALAGNYVLYSVGISADAGLPNRVFGAPK